MFRFQKWKELVVLFSSTFGRFLQVYNFIPDGNDTFLTNPNPNPATNPIHLAGDPTVRSHPLGGPG